MGDWTAVDRCKKPSGWGKRHILATLGFSGFALSYSLRFSLSIAIVAMVNHTALVSRQANNAQSTSTPPTLSGVHGKTILFKSDICPHDKTPHDTVDLKLNLFHEIAESKDINTIQVRNTSSITVGESSEENDEVKGTELPISSDTTVDNEEQGEFAWSEVDQGVILGSFFWGYILTQCFGGWVSQRIGGKWPFGVGLLITGIFSIVTPVAARLGGMPWIIFVRVVQGLAGGVTVPSMQTIIAQWFPPEERGKLGSFAFAGMPFGTSLSMLCSGFLIHYFGWASVFYSTGVMTLGWFLLWGFFAHSSPFDDLNIDEAELRYIQAGLQSQFSRPQGSQSQQSRQKLDVPWSRVLLSLPFWAIVICNTCETWGLYTIMTELPTYMKTVLHFDIKQNSVVSAFPHLLTLLVSVVLTNIGDKLIEYHYLSIGAVRKLCTTIAMWGSAAALLGVAYSGCDRVKTVLLLAMAVAALGGKYGGYLVNIIDIAPNYAGILMGVCNTAASVPGVVAPWVAGMLINENPSLENWRLVFLITSAIAFCGNLVFILFASGVQQSWNHGSDNANDPNAETRTTATLDSKSSKEVADEIYIIQPPNIDEPNQELPLPPILVNIRGGQLQEEKNGLRCLA